MKSRFTVLVVGIIALLSWWLLSTEQKKQIVIEENNHYIDAFINKFTLTSTDKSGKTVYTLKADRLEHYYDQVTSRIIKPVIDIPHPDGHWIISADFGVIDDNQIILNLYDNVIMKQVASESALLIETQKMTINTQSQIIKSDQTIKIQDGSLNLVSDGMHFSNRDQRLKLLSNVNGTYVPR